MMQIRTIWFVIFAIAMITSTALAEEPLIKVETDQEQYCWGDEVAFKLSITNIDDQNET